MAYIGREPQIGNFQVCDAISTVNNQAAYTMQVGGVNVSPETANHMLVSLNGILQAPTSSYTVSGSTITFASNLVTGDVINFIQILGSVLDLGVPSDSTVSLAKLTATGTKDATTFLRGDNTFAEAGGGAWNLISTVTCSSTTNVDFNNLASTYQMYVVIASNVRLATDGANVEMNFGTDGSTYAANKTSVFNEGYNNDADNSTGFQTSAGNSLGNSTANQKIIENASNDANEGKAGQFRAYFSALGQEGNYASYDVFSTIYQANNYIRSVRATGHILVAADCIRFLTSTGGFATGKFSLYGVSQ